MSCIFYSDAAAENDPSNPAGRATSRLCKELIHDVAKYMAGHREYFGGLGNPVLLGSDEFRAGIGAGPGAYYSSLLVSCDFSGEEGVVVTVLYGWII